MEKHPRNRRSGPRASTFVECSPFADFVPTVASSQEAQRLLTEDFIVTYHRISPGRCTSQGQKFNENHYSRATEKAR